MASHCRPGQRVCPAQVAAKVADAVSKGAKVATGGAKPRFQDGSLLNNGSFFEPTVLVGKWGCHWQGLGSWKW